MEGASPPVRIFVNLKGVIFGAFVKIIAATDEKCRKGKVPNKVPVARRSQRNPQVKEVKSTVSSGKNKWLHVYQVRLI